MIRTIEDLKDEAVNAMRAKIDIWNALARQGMSKAEIEKDVLYIEACANAERAQTRLWRVRRQRIDHVVEVLGPMGQDAVSADDGGDGDATDGQAGVVDRVHGVHSLEALAHGIADVLVVPNPEESLKNE